MDVLSIGNSFSEDATRYLHEAAILAGKNINTANLYIGGCSLSMHYRNMLADAKSYMLEYNGNYTGFYVTMKEALLSRDWDVVTVQQVSHLSTKYETYQPYLDALCEYIRKLCPKAKLVLHETWGYRPDTDRLTKFMGCPTHSDMYAAVKAANAKAAEAVNPYKVIHTGAVIEKLVLAGKRVHRDEIHMSLGLGRLAAALAWCKALTGVSAHGTESIRFDEPIDPADIALAESIVDDLDL